jgi:predicted transport protein
MSDLKLFRVSAGKAQELAAPGVDVEKALQTEVEKHLEALVAVRFLASEYSTGPTHGGRIDTLGIDENGSPVIIEYKRTLNQNVINQGLYYLDWLLDHRAEFELLVINTYGNEAADQIDWTNPRLLCLAGDFTKYDEHAVQQMNRNIELIRYRRYDDGALLLLELVNAITGDSATTQLSTGGKKPTATVTDLLKKASPELAGLYQSVRSYCEALGDDVQVKTLKNYFAFRRLKNFACVEVHPSAGDLLAYVKVDPTTVALREGFTRDVRNIGHFGTGDLEIRIASDDDLELAKPLLAASYGAS